MADDDIDIEEHDILDNPLIRKMFPDLSIIKKEMSEFGAGDLKNDMTLKPTKIKKRKRKRHQFHEKHTPYKSFKREHQKVKQYVNVKKLQKAYKLEKMECKTPSIGGKYETNNSSNVKTSKDKPSPVRLPETLKNTSAPPITENIKFLQDITNLNVKVTVENIEPFLNRSNRYCKLCLRLFPSVKNLADHNYVMHPEVGIISVKTYQRKNSSPTSCRYECEFCKSVFSSMIYLLRHKINCLIQKTSKTNQSTVATLNKHHKKFKCTHCNHNFSSQQLLINHMYNVLQSKNIIDKKVIDSAEKIALASPQHWYKCPYCSWYTKAYYMFVTHVKETHNEFIEQGYEKVAFDPQCKFCEKKFGSIVLFNRHLRFSHPETITGHKKILPFNDVKKTECTETTTINNDTSQTASAIDMNAKKTEENIAMIDKLQNCPKVKRYILKSVLFKCLKCDVYFISGCKAANHIKHVKELIYWKCLKCLRVFKKEDEMLHTHQHSFTDTFDVITVTTNSFLSLLYKCPNCISYFFENDLFSHYSSCKLQPPQSAYCKICDIFIDMKLQDIHDEHHNIGKNVTNIFVESDIIVYYEDKILITTETEGEEIYSAKKIRNLEFKNDFGSQIVSVKQKKQMLSFIYCNKCNSFISRMHNLYNHTKAQCSNLISFVCKYCGLNISSKLIDHHRKMHQRLPGITVNHFQFYNLSGNQLMRPPIPEYPKCNQCLIHFITKTAIITHKCNDSFFTCSLCDIKLSVSAFPLHMAFHNYYPRTDFPKFYNNLESSNLPPKSGVLDLDQTSDQDLIESKKSHENYLLAYICKNCKIAVDDYDKVIEHSQHHIGNELKERLSKACNTCNVIYDVECYENHKMLHANNYNKIFTILNFDVFYSTSDINIWLDHLFGPLPKEQIGKILDKSIYKTERRVKLKVIQNGLAHLTLYRCAKCRTFMDSSLIYEHCKANNCCDKSKMEICSYCGISLISKEFCIKHESMHATENVTSKSYRIVLFNCEEHKHINHSLSLPNHYVLFECRNCRGIVDKRFYSQHNCNLSDLTKCTHCGLLLYSNDYMAHVLKHKEFCSFTDNNMKVIIIGSLKSELLTNSRLIPTFSGSKLDYLLYECADCLVCVDGKKESLSHRCPLSSSAIKCPKCELCFEVHQFVNHRTLHECDLYFVKEHITVIQFQPFGSKSSKISNEAIIVLEDEDNFGSKANNFTTDIIDYVPENRVDNIYECICGVNFLTESSALSHYKTCSNNARSVKQICSKCGLYFNPGVLYEHLLTHHGSKRIVQKFNIMRICENMST